MTGNRREGVLTPRRDPVWGQHDAARDGTFPQPTQDENRMQLPSTVVDMIDAGDTKSRPRVAGGTPDGK